MEDKRLNSKIQGDIIEYFLFIGKNEVSKRIQVFLVRFI